jgi:hypothetical protein
MADPTPSNSKPDQGRVARRAFPRMSLSRTLELVNAVHKLGHGEPVRRVSAFNQLNRSADSGPSRQLVSTANSGYGLLKGNATSPYLELTERGQALVSSNDKAHLRRVIYDALMDNAIFKASIDRYRDRALPNDEVFSDYIKSAFSLSDADSKLAVTVIKENMRDYDLIESVAGGREVVVAPEVALANLQSSTESSGADSDEKQDQDRAEPMRQSSPNGRQLSPTSMQVLPQIAFNIQIQLPSDASPETYEAIFKNIAAHLLGRSEE